MSRRFLGYDPDQVLLAHVSDGSAYVFPLFVLSDGQRAAPDMGQQLTMLQTASVVATEFVRLRDPRVADLLGPKKFEALTESIQAKAADLTKIVSPPPVLTVWERLLKD